MTARFGDGYATTADVLVGADGIGSATRKLVTGRDDLRYSGYVAFRGLEPEGSLPDDLRDLLAERFKVTQAVGRHKATAGLPTADPGREERQIARLRQLAAEAELDPEFSEAFLRFIIDEVIRHHTRMQG